MSSYHLFPPSAMLAWTLFSDPFPNPFPWEKLTQSQKSAFAIADDPKSFVASFNSTGNPPHYRYPDVMIDLEAFADTPDSAPAQIALLFFDRDDRSKKFLKYNYEPRPMDAIQLGFNVTPDTLKWWDDQGMKPDLTHGEPLTDVLDDITRDITLHGSKNTLRVWSRGNAYDLSILRLAYTRTGRKLPWKFWNDRDVRTWLEGCQFKSPRKNNHDAMQDCENQALDIIEATAEVKAPEMILRGGGESIKNPTATPV